MTRLHETGADRRRRLPRIPAVATPTSSSSPDYDDPPLRRLQPLRARLRDDADIERICTEPDRRGPRVVPGLSPAVATPWVCCATSGRITATRASSRSILSPSLMRRWRLFHLVDDPEDAEPARATPSTTSAATAPDPARLARQYDLGPERPRHPGGRRGPDRRPPPVRAPPRAGRQLLEAERRQGGAAAPRRPVGLRCGPEGGGRRRGPAS